jgi:peptide methionine sulfoxide reductase MsrA
LATNRSDQADGQFTDIGPSYRAAIFYSSDEEKKNAEASKEKLARSGKFNRPIVTEILPAMKFYPPKRITRNTTSRTRRISKRSKKDRAGFVRKENLGGAR